MRFDPDTRTGLRSHLMARGLALATLLAEVLAGKDKEAALRALGLTDRPGLRPEERLRRALDQVEARRRLLDADDDRFGRCDVCGEDLGLPALGELPWADRCRAHADA
jgi:RNA polymerase-binding transcription factor DksA